MRESSCLLPDVLCLASYTCGLHYSLPPARLHADDMNNRSLAIKARVREGWETSPSADADLCTLTEKTAARWLSMLPGWVGGLTGEAGGQAAERKLLNVSQLGRERGWGSTRQGWTGLHLDGKSRCREGGPCEHAHTSHTCEATATKSSYWQRSQGKGTRGTLFTAS